MSKSVMISMKPKQCWFATIIGEKEIQVYKTKPKFETPFKCYIYCTEASKRYQFTIGGKKLNSDKLYYHPVEGMRYAELSDNKDKGSLLNGKVIGEFICDRITKYPYEPYNDGEHYMPFGEFEKTGLNGFQIYDYLGTQDGYGWHISDLIIYDEPKELHEFHAPCGSKYDGTDCHRVITRPPQPWCYVEDIH